ncbi:hypothetical protein BN1723_020487, partial [Verticillium longisporum]
HVQAQQHLPPQPRRHHRGHDPPVARPLRLEPEKVPQEVPRRRRHPRPGRRHPRLQGHGALARGVPRGHGALDRLPHAGRRRRRLCRD